MYFNATFLISCLFFPVFGFLPTPLKYQVRKQAADDEQKNKAEQEAQRKKQEALEKLIKENEEKLEKLKEEQKKAKEAERKAKEEAARKAEEEKKRKEQEAAYKKAEEEKQEAAEQNDKQVILSDKVLNAYEENVNKLLASLNEKDAEKSEKIKENIKEEEKDGYIVFNHYHNDVDDPKAESIISSEKEKMQRAL